MKSNITKLKNNFSVWLLFGVLCLALTRGTPAHGEAAPSLNLPTVLSAPVTPGAVGASIPFEVSGIDSMYFNLVAPVDGTTFVLKDGAGNVVLDSTSPTVEFTAGDDMPRTAGLPGGIFHIGTIPSPSDGNWIIDFSFPAAPEATVVVATLFFETPFQAGLVLMGNDFVVGQDSGLGAMVLNAGLAILGLTPEIVVTPDDPLGTVMTFSALDDGQNADGLANDGIYTATVTFQDAGKFSVSGTVQIPDGADTINRTFSPIAIEVQNSPVSDTGINVSIVNGPLGCVESVNVFTIFTANTVGDYVTRAYLKASNGNEITLGKRIENLAPTIQTVILDFSAEDIRNGLGVDGPYTVSRVDFYAISGDDMLLGASVTDTGDTEAITLDNLCRPDAIDVGNPDDSPDSLPLKVENVITDGFISAVKMTIPIYVTLAGSYSFSFKVIGLDNLEAFVSSSIFTLAAGANEVVVEAAAEGFLGVDGPYDVVAVLVSGPAGAASINQLGDSFEGSRWQFAPKINGDLDNDDDVDVADRGVILENRNLAALTPGDRRDLNRDGKINILDARSVLGLRCDTGLCVEATPPIVKSSAPQLTDKQEQELNR